MNFIFFITLFTISLSATAVGPQGGNGGSACVPDSPVTGTSSYRAFDELSYSPVFDWVYFEHRDLGADPIPAGVDTLDLTKTAAGTEAFLVLRNLEKFHPGFSEELSGLFQSLKKTFVTDKSFTQDFAEESLGNIYGRLGCIPGTEVTVMATFYNGAIIVDRQAWNGLSVKSQSIILIHEILRQAEMFRGWTKFQTAEDILELTMHIREYGIWKLGRNLSFKEFLNRTAGQRTPLPAVDFQKKYFELRDLQKKARDEDNLREFQRLSFEIAHLRQQFDGENHVARELYWVRNDKIFQLKVSNWVKSFIDVSMTEKN